MLIALEPERFGLQRRPGRLLGIAHGQRMVRKGFRAQLKTGSLLTGNRFVDLGFYPKAPARVLGRAGSYPEIPPSPPPWVPWWTA